MAERVFNDQAAGFDARHFLDDDRRVGTEREAKH
jgi:hypothetical protein